jgi:hypothetical protein
MLNHRSSAANRSSTHRTRQAARRLSPALTLQEIFAQLSTQVLTPTEFSIPWHGKHDKQHDQPSQRPTSAVNRKFYAEFPDPAGTARADDFCNKPPTAATGAKGIQTGLRGREQPPSNRGYPPGPLSRFHLAIAFAWFREAMMGTMPVST